MHQKYGYPNENTLVWIGVENGNLDRKPTEKLRARTAVLYNGIWLADSLFTGRIFKSYGCASWHRCSVRDKNSTGTIWKPRRVRKGKLCICLLQKSFFSRNVHNLNEKKVMKWDLVIVWMAYYLSYISNNLPTDLRTYFVVDCLSLHLSDGTGSYPTDWRMDR